MGRDAEMVEFRLARTFRGQPCELHFFQTFSGYSHPVRPVKPLRWREVLGRKGFCKAYLCPAKFGTAFVFFKGQSFKRTPVDLLYSLTSNGTAERYFAVLREGDSIVAGKELEPQDVVDVDEYLHATFRPNTERLDRVELVKIDAWYSYDYTYDDRGVLIRAVIDNGYRKSILEPGQEPRIIRDQR